MPGPPGEAPYAASPGLKWLLAALCAWVLVSAPRAADLDQSLEQVAQTNREAATSQQRIDNLSRETQEVLEEYRRLRNATEYQAAHTRELEQLEQAQQQQIARLKWQVEQAGITQQRILPLMHSMADALEKFIVLDLPFHHDERIKGALQLKQRLRQPGLGVASKFRMVLEAWQLEHDYNSGIEAYRGTLDLQGQARSVEFLRVGRVALYYRSLDGRDSGIWSRLQQDWEDLDPRHGAAIERALRVARNQVAPELMILPMTPPRKPS